MGGTTWYFISFDYALGKALQRDTTEAIVKAGGSVLGSVSHPLGATDFGSYLLQAQASGAKVIALADTGADAINAIRQAAEFQVVGPDRRLAALFLQITDIDALGLAAAQGLILSEAFYWDLNDSTRAFSARFAERMGGRMPTEDQAAAYSATLAYLRAVKTSGTIEGDRVVDGDEEVADRRSALRPCRRARRRPRDACDVCVQGQGAATIEEPVRHL